MCLHRLEDAQLAVVPRIHVIRFGLHRKKAEVDLKA